MWYSCITTLAIWVYNEKEVVFADISNPNTSISKIIDLIRLVGEWAEIAFSGRQNDENEHCETLKKLKHKLNLNNRHAYTRHLMWYSCIITLEIWVYIEKVVVHAFISYPNSSISKITDFKGPVDEWAEIAFWCRQNDENEHCETLKKVVHKIYFNK